MAEKENIKDKLENLKEGHRKSNKDIIESLFAILEYLKNNTDVDNPTSQTQMRKVEEISEYLGTKSTFHNKMVNMAIALDSADGVTLNERRDCRLMFDSIDALIKEYESDEYFDDDDDELTLAEKINSVRGIYYNHPFSKSEVTDLINAVKMSKAIDEDKKPDLIERIKTELASSHYKEYTCPIYNTENTDSQGLRENLNTIQQAISNRQQIAFKFNYYTTEYDLKASQYILKPVLTKRKDTFVSPHFIVADKGRFYMLGCFESDKPRYTEGKKKLCIYRIDLMSDIKIRRIGKSFAAATGANNVNNAVQGNSYERFKNNHLGMSYDTPSTVTLKVRNPYKTGTNNLTFIHDSFGEDYKITTEAYKKKHKLPKNQTDFEIVEVRTSPYGIVNWALQYSDKVEVIGPENVVKSIKERVEELCKKYNVNV